MSHATALEVWGLRRQPPGEPLHLSVPVAAGLRSRPGVVVHHRNDFVVAPPQVIVRLDGAATHGDPRQREIDLRRGALLATLDILVVRYAHRRLVTEPAAVRREILAILASRRASR